MTGCGVTVSATRASTPGSSSKTRAPTVEAPVEQGAEPARVSLVLRRATSVPAPSWRRPVGDLGAPSPLAVDVDGFDRDSGTEGFLEQVDAFDDEAALVLARTAAPHQAPQPLDPLVPVGETAQQPPRVYGRSPVTPCTYASCVPLTSASTATPRIRRG